MKKNTIKCFYCGCQDSKSNYNDDKGALIVECPICGNYKYTHIIRYGLDEKEHFGKNFEDEIAFYLFHKGVHIDTNMFISQYKPQYVWLYDEFPVTEKNEWSLEVSLNEIKAFNAITLHEKVLLILQYIASHSEYYGAEKEYTKDELYSLLFIKRHKDNGIVPNDVLEKQKKYLLDYLQKEGFIEFNSFDDNMEGHVNITLTPSGWGYVEKNTSDSSKSKDVFVAMSFAPEAKDTRIAIRNAIAKCNFIPKIMDEIEHNHMIVPEMLYQIRQARFVIADFTQRNNGAYYEAGYALGKEKEVIHLCRKKEFDEKGIHFDIAQINTIVWENEKDLEEKLIKRIEATIS